VKPHLIYHLDLIQLVHYYKRQDNSSDRNLGAIVGSMKVIELHNGSLTARIALLGAELRQLSFAGRDLIWAPEAALWDGTCPILFPVVGRVIGDVIRANGLEFPMPMHGFALTSPFSITQQADDVCTFELRANEATRCHYPYDFTLTMTYRLSSDALQISATISNLGQAVMPASLGLHPGFRWPLVSGARKEDHLLTFAEAGPVTYTRPVDRLVGPDRFILALEGRSLRLTETLFEKGGLLLLGLQARSLRYHMENGSAAIRIDFPEIDRVILWSRPGGDFLCIEPLLGYADPVGFAGDIMEKPGMAHIAPGETYSLPVTITPEFMPA
jgi:galactose mutarotase-like enzyme